MLWIIWFKLSVSEFFQTGIQFFGTHGSNISNIYTAIYKVLYINVQGISTGKYKSVHSSMLCLPGESKHWLKVVEIYYSRRNKNTKLKPAMKWAVYGKITRDMKALLPYQSADLYSFLIQVSQFAQFSYGLKEYTNRYQHWKASQ